MRGAIRRNREPISWARTSAPSTRKRTLAVSEAAGSASAAAAAATAAAVAASVAAAFSFRCSRASVSSAFIFAIFSRCAVSCACQRAASCDPPGHQQSSAVISGHQWSSEVISAPPPAILQGRAWSEDAIRRGNQKRQSEEAIRRGNQKRQSEEAIRRGNQKRQSEEAIRRGNQQHSPAPRELGRPDGRPRMRGAPPRASS